MFDHGELLPLFFPHWQSLAILKDDGVREPVKQRGVEKILGALTGAAFNRLVNLGKSIVDFSTGSGDKVRSTHPLLSRAGPCSVGRGLGAPLVVRVSAAQRCTARSSDRCARPTPCPCATPLPLAPNGCLWLLIG
jgi:hypothetical protein